VVQPALWSPGMKGFIFSREFAAGFASVILFLIFALLIVSY
jgi:hypothetical protein